MLPLLGPFKLLNSSVAQYKNVYNLSSKSKFGFYLPCEDLAI